jgi:hypothetical protein
MMTLTKVVLAGLGYALVKNGNQVAKELQKSNKPKAKPNTAQEIINKPVTLDIKPDGFGKIEKPVVITKAPERKITRSEPEKEPEKKLSKLDEYVLEQVDKEQHKNDKVKDIDSYVMDEVNAEMDRLKNALEREKKEKEALREKYKEHLYKSHVDNDWDDSKRIQKEIKEGIDSRISASARDESILKVVENAYMDFKSMNGGSYAINDSERNELRKVVSNKNITTDAFRKIMDNEKHRSNSEFERVLKERGLDKSKPSYNNYEYDGPASFISSWL